MSKLNLAQINSELTRISIMLMKKSTASSRFHLETASYLKLWAKMNQLGIASKKRKLIDLLVQSQEPNFS